jgi:hypothetical protein
MIATGRMEILQLLGRVSELAPDVRFGQLIANLSYLAMGPSEGAIWDVEDADLLNAIKEHLADLSARATEVA